MLAQENLLPVLRLLCIISLTQARSCAEDSYRVRRN